MKCNGIEFTYRGNDRSGRGERLADLLGDITINFPTEHGSASADLGALIAELDKRLVRKQVEEEQLIASTRTKLPTIANS
jgi:hypothetical protein